MSSVKAKAKSILSLVLALAIVLSSFAAIPATKASAADSVVVNLNKTYQTIRGFGGINLPEWAGSDMTTAQVNRAFGNGTYDLGLSILRIYVSDDRNQWYKALATAKTAIANGAIVFATPWNPPASMSETFTRTYTEWNGQVKTQYNQKRLRRDKYGDYAQHLNDFVSYMKNNGVNLYAISMANEPDYGHDWTWWTSDECATFLANYAGQINCRVISPESFSYNKEYYNKILNNSAAYNNTDIFGTHFYGTSRSNMDFPALENCGKEIWMTEVYVPNSDANSANRWPEAIQVSENIHNGLVVGNMNAYVWWYIRRSYGPMTEDGNISKRGYCMAQYSKFVRPGYVRVDATEIPTSGVYVSAYKGNNQAVIVAVNTGSTGYAQNFSISGNTIKKVDRYRTSSSENLALTSDLECSSNNFWATLPANSVSTFVVTLNSSTGSNTGSNNNTGTNGSVNIGNENTIQCESMTKSGTYAGTVTSPFNGVVLYANKDAVSFNKYFANNTHDFTLRGASNGNRTAKVDLVINDEKKGTFTFYGTSATEYTLKGITHPTGNINIKLVVSADDGTWDVYLDQLSIGSGSNTGSSSNTTQQVTFNSTTKYKLVNRNSGKVLDVQYGSKDDGANVLQYTYQGNANQKWYLEPTGDGYYYITNAYTGKVADVSGKSKDNNGDVIQWTKNGGANQQWKIEATDSGYYKLINRNSGLALDVSGKSTADNGDVIQYTYKGGANQQWKIEAAN